MRARAYNQSDNEKKKNNKTPQASQWWHKAVLTGKLCGPELICRCTNEGTDLSSSWLIIYPAGFMALINFPHLPFLSLYLPLKV